MKSTLSSALKAGFRTLLSNASAVLSMNQRNLLYIYPNNSRKHFPLADDKLLTKQTMLEAGVPVPRTYGVYRHFFELASLEQDLGEYTDFVIKPSKGRAGGGILVIKENRNGVWLGAGGRTYAIDALRRHIADIIFGVYSFDLSDGAVIEERLVQHGGIQSISSTGLADVRVILFRNEPAMAMLRIPTLKSDGRANLHQGAVGAGIDLDTGRTVFAVWHGEPVSSHPDSGMSLIDMAVPFWDELMRVARQAASAVPLDYLGVDISITPEGPVLLEINVRPGLEIQNVNHSGLRKVLESLEEATRQAAQ